MKRRVIIKQLEEEHKISFAESEIATFTINKGLRGLHK